MQQALVDMFLHIFSGMINFAASKRQCEQTWCRKTGFGELL